MGQSAFWEANRSPASQEIPHVLWNPKFHYHFHNSPHQPLSWVTTIQSMPTIPFPEDPLWYYPPIYAWIFQVVSIPQVSSRKHRIHISSPTIRATCPANLTLFYLITRIIFGEDRRWWWLLLLLLSSSSLSSSYSSSPSITSVLMVSILYFSAPRMTTDAGAKRLCVVAKAKRCV